MFQKLKPGIPKRYLLLVAGIIWTIAGCILLEKGSNYVFRYSDHIILRLAIAILFGIAFFLVLFAKISTKHINRIKAIDILKPCIFSFFGFKSYLMMGIMITMGIMLRKFDLVDPDLLYTFYIGMGIPLFISAIRFYSAYFKYCIISDKK